MESHTSHQALRAFDPESPVSPVIMSPNVNGPVDPHEFYMAFDSPTPSELEDGAPMPMPVRHPAADSYPTLHSPSKVRSVSDPAGPGSHALHSMRSNPVLLPSRLPGNVKDIANRIDRGEAEGGSAVLPMPQTRDRSHRAPSAGSVVQKKRSGHVRAPQRSPSMSFDSPGSSFSSNGTIKSVKSQPQVRGGPRYSASKPLFGEITADGTWNGNFDIYEPVREPPPGSEKAQRRGSEGNLALNHGHQSPHQDIFDGSRPQMDRKLGHKRSRSEISRSEMDRAEISRSEAEANHHSSTATDQQEPHVPGAFPTSPPPRSRIPTPTYNQHASRIPIRNRDPSFGSPPYAGARPRSAMSNAADREMVPESPTRFRAGSGKENAMPTSVPRGRYNPPQLSPTQTLAVKVVAPLPKTSPPLRSSRPRQPVSSATTSASRARAAERYQIPRAKDGRRPSEQWLGKPYDAQKERIRRKIPELQEIDFEQRRERIQRAISLNMERRSRESLRSKSRGSGSRSASRGPSRLASNGSRDDAASEYLEADGFQNGAIETSDVPEEVPPIPSEHLTRGLTLETSGLPAPSKYDPDPLTGHTVFEDDSPLERMPDSAPDTPVPAQEEILTLLTPATYKPPSKSAVPSPIKVPPIEAQRANPSSASEVQERPSQVQSGESRVRQTETDLNDNEASLNSSASDLQDGWGLGNGLNHDQGSIRIILDEQPRFDHGDKNWPQDANDRPHIEQDRSAADQEFLYAQQLQSDRLTDGDDTRSSHDLSRDALTDEAQPTPRKRDQQARSASGFHPDSAYVAPHDSLPANSTLTRVLNHYQSTGTVTQEMLEEMQKHVVDLNRISANGGSNAIMVQNLLEQLDSVLSSSTTHDKIIHRELVVPDTYKLPVVTPDTPTGAEFGTVVVYNNDLATHEEEEDFAEKIRRADEDWARQQQLHREDSSTGLEDEHKPPPPPKDFGYTPRSSTGPNSAIFRAENPDFPVSLRISTSGQLHAPEHRDAGVLDSPNRHVSSPDADTAHSVQEAPPLSPPEPALRQPFSAPDFSTTAYSGRESSEVSPSVQKSSWAASTSTRPSFDSQHAHSNIANSQSMTSFADSSARRGSVDANAESQKLAKTASPAASSPEQKRLSKRRHIIKELLDTENTYHQDLKIIEDIYKATCTPDLVAPEDKKILFGNCDEVERFALHFYDEMRKAVLQVYVPAKSHRWFNKRNSFSTTQSDGTTHTVPDVVDDEKDRTTSLGAVFIANLPQMEQIYGTYLKNHDAANQRLAALQSTPTVKCWMDECHANASDITSAWDLDSLLVKPTQRISKYPMLLQQLLDTTPVDHPDHNNLKTATMDSIGMLTRINEAKKRAELVDSIVNNRKRKDSDIRGGIVKAFGRRTDRLKERVGLQEAFQDPEFDDLAHRFGGHYIRLQICMRDVQDYMNRTDKAVELINNYASALELFTDVSPSSLPEIEAKWRRYGQTIRELNYIAFAEHKVAVQKRVLAPLISCIELHKGPQNAIAKRKKRIVDYAKAKADEKRGVKPDKKTLEASEMYVALNDQLKLELPKLYSLTASLVQNCLRCFLDIQLQWNSTWERKLRPLLESPDVPLDVEQIELAFRADYGSFQEKCMELSICNGTLKREASALQSPQMMYADSSEHSSRRRPSTLDGSKRTTSMDSQSSRPTSRRHSGLQTPGLDSRETRYRSDSQMSGHQPSFTTPASMHAIDTRPASLSTPSGTPASASRPTTANQNPSYQTTQSHRQSADLPRSPRPTSIGTTFYTPRPEQENMRFSGIFSSAMPPSSSTSSLQEPSRPPSPPKFAPQGAPTLFVCASLFEFHIERVRREGGYPYLTYVQGEVFDVIAQKGELWLAKNQDDPSGVLGWIWEQHFVILSAES